MELNDDACRGLPHYYIFSSLTMQDHQLVANLAEIIFSWVFLLFYKKKQPDCVSFCPHDEHSWRSPKQGSNRYQCYLSYSCYTIADQCEKCQTLQLLLYAQITDYFCYHLINETSPICFFIKEGNLKTIKFTEQLLNVVSTDFIFQRFLVFELQMCWKPRTC